METTKTNNLKWKYQLKITKYQIYQYQYIKYENDIKCLAANIE